MMMTKVIMRMYYAKLKLIIIIWACPPCGVGLYAAIPQSAALPSGISAAIPHAATRSYRFASAPAGWGGLCLRVLMCTNYKSVPAGCGRAKDVSPLRLYHCVFY
jgi:hypothetical protein